jgi:uncharacterized damage-inducible protein DinB
MTDQYANLSKAELLEHMRAEYAVLEDTLAGLTPQQMLLPGVEGSWSVKDLLAHIAVWQERAAHWLGEALRDEVPAQAADDDEVNRWNEQTYFENKDRPLDAVLADFRRTFQELLQETEVAPQAALFEAGRYAWRAGEPLWYMIAGNTWWHHQEHNLVIRTWMGQKKE